MTVGSPIMPLSMALFPASNGTVNPIEGSSATMTQPTNSQQYQTMLYQQQQLQQQQQQLLGQVQAPQQQNSTQSEQIPNMIGNATPQQMNMYQQGKPDFSSPVQNSHNQRLQTYQQIASSVTNQLDMLHLNPSVLQGPAMPSPMSPVGQPAASQQQQPLQQGQQLMATPVQQSTQAQDNNQPQVQQQTPNQSIPVMVPGQPLNITPLQQHLRYTPLPPGNPLPPGTQQAGAFVPRPVGPVPAAFGVIGQGNRGMTPIQQPGQVIQQGMSPSMIPTSIPPNHGQQGWNGPQGFPAPAIAGGRVSRSIVKRYVL